MGHLHYHGHVQWKVPVAYCSPIRDRSALNVSYDFAAFGTYAAAPRAEKCCGRGDCVQMSALVDLQRRKCPANSGWSRGGVRRSLAAWEKREKLVASDGRRTLGGCVGRGARRRRRLLNPPPTMRVFVSGEADLQRFYSPEAPHVANGRGCKDGALVHSHSGPSGRISSLARTVMRSPGRSPLVTDQDTPRRSRFDRVSAPWFLREPLHPQELSPPCSP